MSSYRLMFLGVRSSLVFSGFGLTPFASGFQSYFVKSEEGDTGDQDETEVESKEERAS